MAHRKTTPKSNWAPTMAVRNDNYKKLTGWSHCCPVSTFSRVPFDGTPPLSRYTPLSVQALDRASPGRIS